jgi:regulator of replication initiation timing
VTALYEQWQAARQQRQDEVLDRRDQVDADLERWQSDRLAHAVQLRQDLAQMVTDLQAETQFWLSELAEQRQASIPVTRQSLQQYAQNLQLETQAKLMNLQEQREANSAALRLRLRQDCQAMQESVSDLRLDIVQDLKKIRQRVQALKKETAILQAGHRQGQAMLRSELLPKLADYVDELQAKVQESLAEVSALRHQAAVAQELQRQEDRQALADSVDDLFDQLAAFRQDLHDQRQALTALVWGNGVAVADAPKPTVRRSRANRAAPTKPAVAKAASSTQAAPAKPAAKPKTQPVANTPTPKQPAKPVAKPEPDVVVSAPAKAKTPPLDEVVYNYLHLSPGARLAEIESELSINRFQAVDALRSLMEKDLVVKENRTYHVQEEAVL